MWECVWRPCSSTTCTLSPAQPPCPQVPGISKQMQMKDSQIARYPQSLASSTMCLCCKQDSSFRLFYIYLYFNSIQLCHTHTHICSATTAQTALVTHTARALGERECVCVRTYAHTHASLRLTHTPTPTPEHREKVIKTTIRLLKAFLGNLCQTLHHSQLESRVVLKRSNTFKR